MTNPVPSVASPCRRTLALLDPLAACRMNYFAKMAHRTCDLGVYTCHPVKHRQCEPCKPLRQEKWYRPPSSVSLMLAEALVVWAHSRLSQLVVAAVFPTLRTAHVRASQCQKWGPAIMTQIQTRPWATSLVSYPCVPIARHSPSACSRPRALPRAHDHP